MVGGKVILGGCKSWCRVQYWARVTLCTIVLLSDHYRVLQVGSGTVPELKVAHAMAITLYISIVYKFNYVVIYSNNTK